MSPLAETDKEKEMRAFHEVNVLIKYIFDKADTASGKITVDKLACYYISYNQEIDRIYSYLDAQRIDQFIARKQTQEAKINLNAKIKAIFRDLGLSAQTFDNHESFIVLSCKDLLKQLGILLQKHKWTINVPTVFIPKFIEVMEKFEAFAEKEMKKQSKNITTINIVAEHNFGGCI